MYEARQRLLSECRQLVRVGFPAGVVIRALCEIDELLGSEFRGELAVAPVVRVVPGDSVASGRVSVRRVRG